MKLDILFLSAIIGVGLALFLERILKITYPSYVSPESTLVSPALTGDPVRDYMIRHY